MMLDVMRKHSRSFLIYILFGIIIAVFVVNFGPQSAGCAASASYAGKLAGEPITISDFTYAQAVWGLRSQQGSEEQLITLRQMVMDKLIVRELLAADAKRMGFNIPNKEINDMIFKGRMLALGRPKPLILGENGQFDYERFSRYVRYYWQITVQAFQVPTAARAVGREATRHAAGRRSRFPRDEVKADFIHKNTKVKLSYVRFSPDEYTGKIDASENRIKAFIAKNEAAIKAHYDANKTSYVKLPKQLQLQMITVKAPEDNKERAVAKAKAEGLHKRIKGGEDFGKVAAAESAHATRAQSGMNRMAQREHGRTWHQHRQGGDIAESQRRHRGRRGEGQLRHRQGACHA